MNSFNVIVFEPNRKRFESYDIMPYLRRRYEDARRKPKKFKEFKKFINDESMYQFWGRCQYEIILLDWPCQQYNEKWDVYNQIKMNIDIITNLLIQDVCEGVRI